ncbi:MAG: hypothetical protein J6J24_05130 [Clostridia bacterium]|nr:hypothetical protein [Clostridia bacterium]
MNNFSQNHQKERSVLNYYPESINLDVKTMTFTRQNENPYKQQSQENNNPQNQSFQSSTTFNASSLFSFLKNSPLATLLSNNNDLLSNILKGGLFSNQNGQNSSLNLQTLSTLFSINKQKNNVENKESIIDIENSYEEL